MLDKEFKVFFWSAIISFACYAITTSTNLGLLNMMGGKDLVIQTLMSPMMWSWFLIALLLKYRKTRLFAAIPLVLTTNSTLYSASMVIVHDSLNIVDLGWMTNLIAAYASIVMIVFGYYCYIDWCLQRLRTKKDQT